MTFVSDSVNKISHELILEKPLQLFKLSSSSL